MAKPDHDRHGLSEGNYRDLINLIEIGGETFHKEPNLLEQIAA